MASCGLAGLARLVVAVIEEILEVVRQFRGAGQGQADKLHIGLDIPDRRGNRIVAFRVPLRSHAVFQVRFVQDLPIVPCEAMPRIVPLAELVRAAREVQPVVQDAGAGAGPTDQGAPQ